MKQAVSGRGFQYIEENSYSNRPVPCRLLGQSSAIGNYEDSFDKPGGSFLWVGEKHHLNREQVEKVIVYMQNWLKTGNLF